MNTFNAIGFRRHASSTTRHAGAALLAAARPWRFERDEGEKLGRRRAPAGRWIVREAEGGSCLGLGVASLCASH